MNRTKTVLLDLDSIVVNIEGPWYERYNRQYNDDLSIEKVTDWNTARFAKAGAKVFDVLKEPGFFEGLQPLPGAIDGVERLLDEDFRVLIVSSAPTVNSYSEKARWVQRWLPELDLKQLVLTYSKDTVRGDVLFDDGPHNLTGYRKAWPDAKLATIAYPYNGGARAADPSIFVTGDYRDTAACWAAFTQWLEDMR